MSSKFVDENRIIFANFLLSVKSKPFANHEINTHHMVHPGFREHSKAVLNGVKPGFYNGYSQ